MIIGKRWDEKSTREICKRSNKRCATGHCRRNQNRSVEMRQMQRSQLYIQSNANSIGRWTDDNVRTLQHLRKSLEILLKYKIQVQLKTKEKKQRDAIRFRLDLISNLSNCWLPHYFVPLLICLPVSLVATRSQTHTKYTSISIWWFSVHFKCVLFYLFFLSKSNLGRRLPNCLFRIQFKPKFRGKRLIPLPKMRHASDGR